MNTDLQLVKHFNLKSGDRIVVPKSNLRLVQHHALYLGQDNFGNHYICENVFGIGVKLTRVTDFFNGVENVTRIDKYSGTDENRKVVIQDALKKLGQAYNLINYNCESFVNDILQKKAESQQVRNTVALVAIFLIIGIIISKK